MEDRFSFLGLNFHNYSLNEATRKLETFIESRQPHMIFTPTAELIVRANEDDWLKNVYNRAHLLTLDSFVVYYSAKLCGKSVKEPVSAVRLMLNFLKIAQQKKYKLFLLGAKEDVVNKAVAILNEQYPGINIVGWHNGYFDFENDDDIINNIKEKKPDVLFVAMSSPLKENFIGKNLEALNVPVCIGVGGTFDIIVGKCRLAPAWISRIGMEWFYRFIQEPKRLWKRYLITNTKFIRLLLKSMKDRMVKNGTTL